MLSEQLDMEDNWQLLKLAWKNQPTPIKAAWVTSLASSQF